MAKGFKHGAGGTDALNFKVVGGTEQPENPKENTIWVNTETDISGWVLSQEEPVEPSGGLVWIGLGTASPASFNALKKGGLCCFLVSCKQYVGGAWVSKDAYLWKDGAWVQFSSARPEREYLIQDGVIDMTAHPHTVTENSSTATTATNGVTYNEKPALSMVGRNGAWCTYSFADAAVPEWATVFSVEIYRMPANQGDPRIAIGGASLTISRGSGNYIADTTVRIDVSSISGNAGNLTFRFQGAAYNSECYIGNAWFE